LAGLPRPGLGDPDPKRFPIPWLTPPSIPRLSPVPLASLSKNHWQAGSRPVELNDRPTQVESHRTPPTVLEASFTRSAEKQEQGLSGCVQRRSFARYGYFFPGEGRPVDALDRERRVGGSGCRKIEWPSCGAIRTRIEARMKCRIQAARNVTAMPGQLGPE